MTDDGNKLSPGGAWVMGTVFVACGIMPILVSLGIVQPSPGAAAPAWIGVSAGLLFVVAGITIVVDYAIAAAMGDTIGPDGDFPPETPFAIRLANFLLGMIIVGLMLAIFGWVAFGPGERHFSTTVSLPFLAWHPASNELSGRIAFGFATVLIGLMFVACGWVGVKRLLRAGR